MNHKEPKISIAAQEFTGLVDSADLTSEEYHRSAGVSSTPFKEFLKSPLHMKTCMSAEFEETEAMYFGQKFHEAMEGKPIKFEWFKTAPPNQRNEELIKRMVDAVHAHPICREILAEKGTRETSAYVKDSETSLYMKARFDRLQHDGLIIDFKTTTKSAKAEEFERSVFNYGYHISAAWYRRVLSQIMPNSPNEFLFVAIEKKAPFGISVLRLKEEVLRFGQDIINANLPRVIECMNNDKWPGYPAEVRDVGIPSWAMNRAPLFEGDEVA